ncbi:MAG TPA: glycosyltransferase family 39 protein [Chloroflexota bacterium]|nr:glycosyltransferase family 39 protein [Chloroflexota bacterium]
MNALVSTPARTGVLIASQAAAKPSALAVWRKRLLSDGFLVFALVSLVFCASGWWLAVIQNSVPGDALSRTYSADAVLYAHEPHLATLGFIWPPLPAFSQIILLRFLPSLAYYGFSGNIITAISAGILAAVLTKGLRGLGLGRWGSIAVVVLLFLNPMMAAFASNGMSEMPFLLFLTLAVFGFSKWCREGRWQPLAAAGFACAAMFFCRYDAAVIAPAMAISIVFVMRLSHREFFPPKVEANMLAFLVPVVYVGFIWLYLNRLIMGSALYFWNSEYSNLYLTRDLKLSQEVIALQGSLVTTAKYFITLVGGFSPLFLAACVLAGVVVIWKRDVALATYAVILLAAPLFQLYEYRSGSTFKFNRFYISVIVSGILLTAFALHSLWQDRHQRIKLLALVLGMLACNVVTWNTIEQQWDPALPHEEGMFVQGLKHPLTSQEDFSNDAKAAAYLDEHVKDRSILIDSVGANVAVLSGRLGLFILPSDSDWMDAATHPQEKVRYIVTVGNITREYHAFDDLYPGIFDNGTAFTSLEADFDNIRIYRVNGS